MGENQTTADTPTPEVATVPLIEPMEAHFEQRDHWANATILGFDRSDIIWAATIWALACAMGIGWEWAVIAFGVYAMFRKALDSHDSDAD